MSEAVLLAGKRGSGKTLGAISLVEKYMKAGRTVATNINLYVDHLLPAYNNTRWYRVPDHPTAADLKLLPLGNPSLMWVEGKPDPQMGPGFDEKKNGLLLLDEVATFLNAREWSGGGRQDFISWLAQSRKYGWDLCFLAQHWNMLDKQIREALIEIQGTVRRMDRMSVPLLSPIWKYFTGEPLHMPKVHFVFLRYGFAQGAPVADRWFWRGKDYYKAYDTLQQISGISGQQGVSTMLSAWDLKGRTMSKWDLRRQMAAGGLVIGLLIGFGGGYAAKYAQAKQDVEKAKPEPVAEVVQDDGVRVRGVVGGDVTRVVLTDGRTVTAEGVKADASGVQYKVGGRWYGEVK